MSTYAMIVMREAGRLTSSGVRFEVYCESSSRDELARKIFDTWKNWTPNHPILPDLSQFEPFATSMKDDPMWEKIKDYTFLRGNLRCLCHEGLDERKYLVSKATEFMTEYLSKGSESCETFLEFIDKSTSTKEGMFTIQELTYQLKKMEHFVRWVDGFA